MGFVSWPWMGASLAWMVLTVAAETSLTYEPKEEGRCGLARVNVCYDLLNRIPVDATLAPYHVCERSLPLGHLDYCGDVDLLLMDRR
jgi:hypothetical protein